VGRSLFDKNHAKNMMEKNKRNRQTKELERFLNVLLKIWGNV
jgi:hypothetical protein